ncbi:MAG: hypothetical protein LBV31_00645, partial [Prevotellaceae bacterium]|nr:hypothetical protein [Prevotellaceae bacterium]
KKTTFPSLGNSLLKNAVKQTVKSLKIDADIYASKLQKTISTEEFNRTALMGQWRIEYRQIGFDRMQLYQQQYLQNALGSSYRYISLINEGSQSADFFEGGKWSFLYRAPVCVVTLPLDLLIFALPVSEKSLQVNLYDIESGNTVSSKHFSVESIDATAYINKMLYDCFYNYKKGRKIK